MPAPRTCRECGAALSPDLRWCGRCLAPVSEFAPRAVVPGRYVETPRPDILYSRWKGGPTSFGPVGRILATVLVFLFGPWTMSAFAILYGPWWIIVAAASLKSIWKRERVVEREGRSATEGWRQRNLRRHPVMFKSIESRWISFVALGLIAIGYVYMLVKMGSGGRFFMAAVTLCVVVGLVLAWLSDV